jgi:hypothetical protein
MKPLRILCVLMIAVVCGAFLGIGIVDTFVPSFTFDFDTSLLPILERPNPPQAPAPAPAVAPRQDPPPASARPSQTSTMRIPEGFKGPTSPPHVKGPTSPPPQY